MAPGAPVAPVAPVAGHEAGSRGGGASYGRGGASVEYVSRTGGIGPGWGRGAGWRAAEPDVPAAERRERIA